MANNMISAVLVYTTKESYGAFIAFFTSYCAILQQSTAFTLTQLLHNMNGISSMNCFCSRTANSTIL